MWENHPAHKRQYPPLHRACGNINHVQSGPVSIALLHLYRTPLILAVPASGIVLCGLNNNHTTKIIHNRKNHLIVFILTTLTFPVLTTRRRHSRGSSLFVCAQIFVFVSTWTLPVLTSRPPACIVANDAPSG